MERLVATMVAYLRLALFVQVALGVSAVALAVLRILGHRSPAFQAFAHLETGLFLGLWAVSARHSRYYGALFLGLTLVEVACFLFLRSSGCDCGPSCPCGVCRCG